MTAMQCPTRDCILEAMTLCESTSFLRLSADDPNPQRRAHWMCMRHSLALKADSHRPDDICEVDSGTALNIVLSAFGNVDQYQAGRTVA